MELKDEQQQSSGDKEMGFLAGQVMWDSQWQTHTNVLGFIAWLFDFCSLPSTAPSQLA